jgi:hypothetical protein
MINNEFLAGIAGGIVGGIIGSLGAWASAYWAPKKLQENQERREEERVWGPRKSLLRLAY